MPNSNSPASLITDSTNGPVNVIVGDMKGLAVNANSQTFAMQLAGSQSANAVLPIIASAGAYQTPGGLNPVGQLYIDTEGYAGGSIHIVSIGTGPTSVAFKISNDAVDFTSTVSLANVGVPLTAPGSGFAGGVYAIPNDSRFIQVSTSGTQTTGTTLVYVHLKAASSSRPGVVLGGGTNIIGNVGLLASSTNGHSAFTGTVTGLTGGTLTQIKAGAASWYGHTLWNPNTVSVYVNFYNASSITYGTTVPVVTVVLPPVPTATAPYGSSPPLHLDIPAAFSSQLYYTTSTSLGTLTAPPSPVIGTVFYN